MIQKLEILQVLAWWESLVLNIDVTYLEFLTTLVILVLSFKGLTFLLTFWMFLRRVMACNWMVFHSRATLSQQPALADCTIGLHVHRLLHGWDASPSPSYGSLNHLFINNTLCTGMERSNVRGEHNMTCPAIQPYLDCLTSKFNL